MLGGKAHRPRLAGKWGFSFFQFLDSHPAPNPAELSREMTSAGSAAAQVSCLPKGMLCSLRALLDARLLYRARRVKFCSKILDLESLFPRAATVVPS